MVFLVTKQQQLFESDLYKVIDEQSALEMMKDWTLIQYDCETKCTNPHIGTLLCAQFGNDKTNTRIVVDCTTVNILTFKEILETKRLIGHNLKFDIQWLYNFGIIPRKVYDTMIVEQFLYLGYSSKEDDTDSKYRVLFNLKDVAKRRLGIDIDKSVRGQIIWRGLDRDTINYAQNDVVWLERIMQSQLKDLREREGLKGAQIECDFVPCIAYLEWCGIKLDQDKWKAKMQEDNRLLKESLDTLNHYCINHPKLKEFVFIDPQGDLWNGFNEEPQWGIDWQKDEAKKPFKKLGFDLRVEDKKTHTIKESLNEKVLTPQKGIDDELLKLYFDYQEHYKVCTSFGQGHLNLINPKTGRLHTNYWQIGTISGRMSSGTGEDKDLARYKKIKQCKMVNMQQLPHDAITRACFVAEKGNLFCSCDYNGMEARIGADVYNEKMLLDEFLYGSGDTHAAYAKVVFAKELEGIEVKDIKKKRPDLRSKVKSVEFSVQFGSDGTASAGQLGIPVEESRALVSNLLKGMKGLAKFKEEGDKFVKANGFVYAMKQTGHRVYIPEWKDWNEIQKSFDSAFWENYKPIKAKKEKAKAEGLNPYYYLDEDEKATAFLVSNQWRTASKWGRLALNCPTQGGGAVVLKTAVINWFNWVVDNGYFGKILLVNLTHDEINSEFPEELKDTYPQLVAKIMQDAGAIYYHKLPLPATPEVDTCWRH